MSGIGTKTVKAAGEGTGKLPKSFIPGKHRAKINGITIGTQNFKTGTKTFLYLDLETEPIGNGFEGWLIDKDNPSKGSFLGQTGRVKSDGYGYEDKVQGQFTYTVVNSVVAFVKAICNEINSTWCDDVDGKYKTIEDFVAGFNNDAPFKDVFLNWCIGGTKEKDENGFPKYWMNLATPSKTDKAKGLKVITNDGNIENLLPFDTVVHVYEKNGSAPAPVQSFKAAPVTETAPWENQTTEDDPFAVDGDDDDDPFAVTE